MSHTPPRLLTSREDLDALERWIVELDDEAVVRLTLDGGVLVEGTVSARPTIEVFRDDAGDEGHNAVLRLDDLKRPETPHFVWLSEIRSVERLA